MTRLKSNRIEAHAETAASTAYGDKAMRHAESEGMPVVVGLPESTGSGVFGKMATYLRKEYASLKRGSDLTLEELLASLVAVTEGDRRLRKQSASLKFLIASDIKDSIDYPVPGVSGAIARPMRAWRQRYNGLGRFMPRPS